MIMDAKCFFFYSYETYWVLDKTGHLRTGFFTITDVLQTKNYSIEKIVNRLISNESQSKL